MKPTKEALYLKAVEQKVLRAIKRRMRILAKDKKLKEEMEKDIYANINKRA
jgi:hypothetical protein